MKNIGIMGGSFDPIHNGHLAIAAAARQALALERVLFIPNPRPPHKDNRGMSAGHHRMRMVELALADHPHFMPCAIEMERPGTVYSVDTVQELLRRDPEQELYFIVGADALDGLSAWKEPERLLTLCRFVILNRPGSDLLLPADFDPKLAALLTQRGVRLEIPPLDISSSDIRARVQSGASISDMLPPAVREYIDEQKMYVL